MGDPGFTTQFAVDFRNLMVDVLARESHTTARVLASVPDDRRDYRPDPASRTAWELAWHVAADVWFLEGIARLKFDPNPDQRHANPAHTSQALAEWYGERVREALDEIRMLSPDGLLQPVELGGVAVEAKQAFPAFVYLLWAQTHMVHHRGQLTAYLRPMGSRVPSIYGPSADESQAG